MSVSFGDVDNPNNPLNKATNWFTSLGFNNSLLLIMILTMIGVPVYIVRYIAPGHIAAIQAGTAKAALDVALIGDKRLDEQGKLYERLIKEGNTGNERILTEVRSSYESDQKRDTERGMRESEITQRLLENNDRLLKVIEAKKNSVAANPDP